MVLLTKLADALRKLTVLIDRQALRNGETAVTAGTALDEYVISMPSAQNAVDALPGWNMAIPHPVDAIAGIPVFFDDVRIHWAIDQLGGVEGKNILELGPLEASHTWMMAQRGAGHILGIEANKSAFLRCLVVKELTGMQRATFVLGDFQQWLEHKEDRYDMIVASGVLYHMQNPVRLLELIAARTDSFYLWTHYFSDAAMPMNDPRRGAFIGDAIVEEHHGVNVRLYRRSYHGAWRNQTFCGGMHDMHKWIEREDIFAIIKALGFDDIRIAHDEPDHLNGPSFSVFAKRSVKTALS